MTVPELLQNMRLLSMATIRERLEKLAAKKPDDFEIVARLFTPETKPR